jgi:hypothetical protein
VKIKESQNGATPTADRLEAAIRKIIPADRQASVEPFIPAAVHGLIVTGGQRRRRKGVKADTNQSAELKDVSQAAAKLLAALEAMQPRASARFKDVGALARAIRTIKIIADVGAPPETSPQAVPQKVSGDPAPEKLAKEAARIYIFMTKAKITVTKCKDAGATGRSVSSPFVDFLTEIFAIRGIRASIETCAEAAREAIGREVSQNNSISISL